MGAPARVWCTLNKPHSIDSERSKDLEYFMLYRTSPKDPLKKEAAHRSWGHIYNTAAYSIDKPNRYQRIAHYTSTNQLLTFFMETCDSRIDFSRRRAALGMWVGVCGAMMPMNSAWDKELCLPLTACQYLLIVRDCMDQTGKTTLKFGKVGAQGF